MPATPPPPPARTPDHFHAVDVLRGFAAVTVLLNHYRQMQYPPGTFDINAAAMAGVLPLYDWLWPFYVYGNWAVQVFWMISGFVFAKVYAGKATPGGEFLIRRIARLYPLHLLTLLLVAVLQAVAIGGLGTSLIVGNNDAWHFVLNLLLASSWGLEQGKSFNAPIWSVSVEMLIYLLFWLVSKPLLSRGLAGPLLLVVAAGMMLRLEVGSHFIWQCAQYFFIGSALFHVAAHHARPVRDLGAIVALMAAVCVLMPVVAGDFRIGNFFLPFAILLVGGAALIDLGPRSAALRRVRFIGDSTYGIYLWYVPLQIAVLLLFATLGVPAAVWQHPAMLFAYPAVCCTAGWLSFTWIEQPANRAVLRWARPRAASERPEAAPFVT
ncbi:acyltransferase family protein [Porphyrobacter sp. AAP82]|uniref:acyltransferase family protein n=1 Tax=Porphyrobacter sp. AAP82 TaxID=1248917 RepID=UPI0002D3C850|nr:acyltransferase [Porphyrobacter sp. AAP82]